MKTIREYIDQLDEINRRDFLKGVGATAGLAATGAAQANWQKQGDILGVDSGTGKTTGQNTQNYKNTSTDGSAVLTLYKGQVQSMGIANTAGKWSPKSKEPMGAIKIDGGPATRVEFVIMGNPAVASIISPGGVAGDSDSQALVNAIVNAKQRVAIDISSLSGNIVQFNAGGVSEDVELDEVATPDAVERIEQLVQYK